MSYELAPGTTVRVDGLMLEMWRAFEDFLCVALAEALRPYGGAVALQDERHHLDLSSPPGELHAQITRLAHRIAVADADPPA